jgi:hypothetical protein
MPSTKELLQTTARAVAESLDFDAEVSSLVRMSEPDDEGNFDLGMKDLEGAKTTDTLLGFEAPADWWALGVFASGWVAPLATGDDHELERGRTTQRPSKHPDRVRMLHCVLVARDGTAASHLRTADGKVIDDELPLGIGLDVIKRSLGLPTAPPVVSITEFFVGIWLHLVELHARRPIENVRRMTWRRTVRAFPIAGSDLPARVTSSSESFAAAALDRLATIDWAELRRWAARGSLGAVIEPELARWMDEGMFSRWVLSQLPSLAVQLDSACRHLTPDAAEMLRATVDHLLLGGVRRDEGLAS